MRTPSQNSILNDIFVFVNDLQIVLRNSIVSSQKIESVIENNEDSALNSEMFRDVCQRNQTQHVKIAKCNQIRVWLSRKVDKYLVHDKPEKTRVFYYPQRLWIAFSLTIVGIISVFSVYVYLISNLCETLIFYRLQVAEVLSRIQGVIGASSFEGLSGLFLV
jgi:hypothetical protein